jgi:hypothetical protein
MGKKEDGGGRRDGEGEAKKREEGGQGRKREKKAQTRGNRKPSGQPRWVSNQPHDGDATTLGQRPNAPWGVWGARPPRITRNDPRSALSADTGRPDVEPRTDAGRGRGVQQHRFAESSVVKKGRRSVSVALGGAYAHRPPAEVAVSSATHHAGSRRAR